MATNESVVFGGVELNDFTNFRIQGFDPGLAAPRWRWVSSADSDGALLADESHYDDAEMTLRIRVTQQASMDSALTKIGTLVSTIQEAQKNPLGSALVWTPAGSTKSFTGYVLGGEVTGLPIELSGDDAGWFQRAPVLTIKLTRRPFWYGAEVTSAATVTNTNRFQLLTVASVTGDVPAEARLVVTDAATQSRRHLEWGLEQRYYNAATNLSIDTFVTSGFGGTSTTRSGSFNTNVIRGTLTTVPVAICGVGNLSHVGTFRVKARVYPVIGTLDPDDLQIRLSWREGDGPLRSNAWTYTPGRSGQWAEVDLGVITIPEKTLGTQRWTGQIEAYSSSVSDTLDIDYVLLEPAGEGYGKARAPVSWETLSAFSARDEFDQTAGNLATKVAPVGGTWAEAGTDVTAFSIDTTNHAVTHTGTSAANFLAGRFGVLGTATFTDVLVQADLKLSALPASTSNLYQAVVARYTDANNWAGAVLTNNSTSSAVRFWTVVTGSATIYTVTLPWRVTAGSFYTLRLVIDAGGRFYVWIAPTGTTPMAPVLVGSSTVVATGGTLATGKIGIYDVNESATAITRSFDNFIGAVPTADAVVFSGRTAEIRHNEAIRQDSTGTYYGPISSYRGSRIFLPPAGSANRTSRIFVKTRRNDIDVAQDDQIADSTTATLHYTPRYLVAPR